MDSIDQILPMGIISPPVAQALSQHHIYKHLRGALPRPQFNAGDRKPESCSRFPYGGEKWIPRKSFTPFKTNKIKILGTPPQTVKKPQSRIPIKSILHEKTLPAESEKYHSLKIFPKNIFQMLYGIQKASTCLSTLWQAPLSSLTGNRLQSPPSGYGQVPKGRSPLSLNYP